MSLFCNSNKIIIGLLTICLFIALNASSIAQPPPQQWFWTNGASPPPSSFHTLYSLGIGKDISTPPIPFYTRNMLHWPTLLVQSQSRVVDNKMSRAIIRIQDKRFDEPSNSNKLWAGEPQIQFWSNEYHTMHEWWMGSIQGVADVDNQNTDIFLAKPNVAGGLAFF